MRCNGNFNKQKYLSDKQAYFLLWVLIGLLFIFSSMLAYLQRIPICIQGEWIHSITYIDEFNTPFSTNATPSSEPRSKTSSESISQRIPELHLQGSAQLRSVTASHISPHPSRGKTNTIYNCKFRQQMTHYNENAEKIAQKINHLWLPFESTWVGFGLLPLEKSPFIRGEFGDFRLLSQSEITQELLQKMLQCKSSQNLPLPISLAHSHTEQLPAQLSRPALLPPAHHNPEKSYGFSPYLQQSIITAVLWYMATGQELSLLSYESTNDPLLHFNNELELIQAQKAFESFVHQFRALGLSHQYRIMLDLSRGVKNVERLRLEFKTPDLDLHPSDKNINPYFPSSLFPLSDFPASLRMRIPLAFFIESSSFFPHPMSSSLDSKIPVLILEQNTPTTVILDKLMSFSFSENIFFQGVYISCQIPSLDVIHKFNKITTRLLYISSCQEDIRTFKWKGLVQNDIHEFAKENPTMKFVQMHLSSFLGSLNSNESKFNFKKSPTILNPIPWLSVKDKRKNVFFERIGWLEPSYFKEFNMYKSNSSINAILEYRWN